MGGLLIKSERPRDRQNQAATQEPWGYDQRAESPHLDLVDTICESRVRSFSCWLEHEGHGRQAPRKEITDWWAFLLEFNPKISFHFQVSRFAFAGDETGQLGGSRAWGRMGGLASSAIENDSTSCFRCGQHIVFQPRIMLSLSVALCTRRCFASVRSCVDRTDVCCSSSDQSGQWVVEAFCLESRGMQFWGVRSQRQLDAGESFRR